MLQLKRSQMDLCASRKAFTRLCIPTHHTMSLAAVDEHGAPALWKNEVNKREIHFALKQDRKRAHTLAFGCIDVSHTSTGDEPMARINGSSKGYESEYARTEHSFENHQSKARNNVSPKIR